MPNDFNKLITSLIPLSANTHEVTGNGQWNTSKMLAESQAVDHHLECHENWSRYCSFWIRKIYMNSLTPKHSYSKIFSKLLALEVSQDFSTLLFSVFLIKVNWSAKISLIESLIATKHSRRHIRSNIQYLVCWLPGTVRCEDICRQIDDQDWALNAHGTVNWMSTNGS